jgi:ribose transport system substrate-binding protein
MVGSVSHEPATYGTALINLGMSLLRGQTVAPYNYVNHRVVTRESLLAAR